MMRLFDFTHSYQPFEPPYFVPKWAESNLRDFFIPLSRAMKEGVVKRHVQLQGWTIEAYQRSPEPIRSLAREVLENLKEAAARGNIRLGFSGYSHPILPFLSDEVFTRSIKEDYAVIEKYLGNPTWFWFPEGACDRRSLEILFKEFPDVYAVVPDGCLGKRNFSGFFKVKEGGPFDVAQGRPEWNRMGGRIVICNSILKDIFMNACDYGKLQPYSPKGLSQPMAEKMIDDPSALKKGLSFFTQDDFAVLARDLENAGSKYGLLEFKKGTKELKSFYESRDEIEFAFVEDGNFDRSLSLDDIQPSSWEPLADNNNPYPYWNLTSWLEFVNAFCESYKEDFSNQQLVVLASDVPWHLLARKEWGPNPEHSQIFVRDVVMPIVKDISDADLTRAAEVLLEDLRGV